MGILNSKEPRRDPSRKSSRKRNTTSVELRRSQRSRRSDITKQQPTKNTQSSRSSKGKSRCSCCERKYNLADTIRKRFPPRQCAYCYKHVCKKCYNNKRCHKCSTRQREEIKTLSKLEEMQRDELVDILKTMHYDYKQIDEIKETSALILAILNHCNMDENFVKEFEAAQSKRNTPQIEAEVEVNNSPIRMESSVENTPSESSRVTLRNKRVMKTNVTPNPYENGQPRFVDTFDNLPQQPNSNSGDSFNEPLTESQAINNSDDSKSDVKFISLEPNNVSPPTPKIAEKNDVHVNIPTRVECEILNNSSSKIQYAKEIFIERLDYGVIQSPEASASVSPQTNLKSEEIEVVEIENNSNQNNSSPKLLHKEIEVKQPMELCDTNNLQVSDSKVSSSFATETAPLEFVAAEMLDTRSSPCDNKNQAPIQLVADANPKTSQQDLESVSTYPLSTVSQLNASSANPIEPGISSPDNTDLIQNVNIRPLATAIQLDVSHADVIETSVSSPNITDKIQSINSRSVAIESTFSPIDAIETSVSSPDNPDNIQSENMRPLTTAIQLGVSSANGIETSVSSPNITDKIQSINTSPHSAAIQSNASPTNAIETSVSSPNIADEKQLLTTIQSTGSASSSNINVRKQSNKTRPLSAVMQPSVSLTNAIETSASASNINAKKQSNNTRPLSTVIQPSVSPLNAVETCVSSPNINEKVKPLKTSTPRFDRTISLCSLPSAKAIEEFDIQKLRQILDRALEQVTEKEMATLVTNLWMIRRQMKPVEQNVSVSTIGSLTDIEVGEVIPKLSIKQLKTILTKHQISIKNCNEKQELVQKLTLLWKDQAKGEAFTEEISKGDQCVICLSERANCVFLECNHMVVCNDCSNSVKECPICRQFIIKVIRVFRA